MSQTQIVNVIDMSLITVCESKNSRNIFEFTGYGRSGPSWFPVHNGQKTRSIYKSVVPEL